MSPVRTWRGVVWRGLWVTLFIYLGFIFVIGDTGVTGSRCDVYRINARSDTRAITIMTTRRRNKDNIGEEQGEGEDKRG